MHGACEPLPAGSAPASRSPWGSRHRLGSDCRRRGRRLAPLRPPRTDGAPEVLHEHLCLLDLRRVHLAADHGAERHLGVAGGWGRHAASGSGPVGGRARAAAAGRLQAAGSRAKATEHHPPSERQERAAAQHGGGGGGTRCPPSADLVRSRGPARQRAPPVRVLWPFPPTLVPSSCAMPSASAVFPVPGAPAISSARPAIFLALIMSTTMPHASRACSCPTKPAAMGWAVPSSFRPSPLMCVWVATRWVLVVEATSSILILDRRRCDLARVDAALLMLDELVQGERVDNRIAYGTPAAAGLVPLASAVAGPPPRAPLQCRRPVPPHGRRPAAAFCSRGRISVSVARHRRALLRQCTP
jgi:hypothetical protein